MGWGRASVLPLLKGSDMSISKAREYFKFMLGYTEATAVGKTLADLENEFYSGVLDGTVSPLGPLGESYVAGRFYTPGLTPGSATTLAMTLNRLFFAPIRIDRLYTFKSFAISVNVGGTAGAIVRAGVYSDSGGAPLTLIKALSTNFDVTTTGTKEIVEDIPLNPGRYWLATVNQVAAATLDARSTNIDEDTALLNLATVPLNAGIWSQESVAGALPATATPDANRATAPAMAIRG